MSILGHGIEITESVSEPSGGDLADDVTTIGRLVSNGSVTGKYHEGILNLDPPIFDVDWFAFAAEANTDYQFTANQDPAAQGGVILHLAQHVDKEEELPVAAPGDQGVFGVSCVLDDEPVVGDAVSSAHPVLVGFPTLPVGRIAQHEVERLALEGIIGQCGVFRSANDVGVGVLLALEE